MPLGKTYQTTSSPPSTSSLVSRVNSSTTKVATKNLYTSQSPASGGEWLRQKHPRGTMVPSLLLTSIFQILFGRYDTKSLWNCPTFFFFFQTHPQDCDWQQQHAVVTVRFGSTWFHRFAGDRIALKFAGVEEFICHITNWLVGFGVCVCVSKTFPINLKAIPAGEWNAGSDSSSSLVGLLRRRLPLSAMKIFLLEFV